jgi:hypothetical protein
VFRSLRMIGGLLLLTFHAPFIGWPHIIDYI